MKYITKKLWTFFNKNFHRFVISSHKYMQSLYLVGRSLKKLEVQTNTPNYNNAAMSLSYVKLTSYISIYLSMCECIDTCNVV